MAEEKYVKRRRHGAVVYTPIAVLLIVIILIFGISVFFRISEIEVTGAKKYTVEQILSVSDIKKGDNLIFVDSKGAEEKIGSNLPYLNGVIIEKIVPDKIIIKVTESQPIAVLSYSGSWWIVDQKARVLEEADDNSASRKIKISGISPLTASEGQEIIVDDTEQTKLKYLIDILSAINKAGIAAEVGELDVSNIGNISFTYSDRFTVLMGSGENADYKFVLLQNVMTTELDSDDKGKIDLSVDNEARFIPS